MQQNVSALHAMARAYAAAGIPIFPCEVGGKRPATEKGFHDATTDIAIIDGWWKNNPDYNLAICPDDAGLFVVDIDPGADTDILTKFPTTYKVKTPRGGWHLYFAGSGRSSANKISPHIDTRGVGGYVLVPPSSVGGKSYELERDTDYAAVPQWVNEKLAVADTPVSAAVEEQDLPINIERAKKYLLKEKPGIEFQGSDEHAYRVACAVKDFGISQETAFDLMWDHWVERCEGEWTEDFVRLKIYNAYQHGQNEPGAYGIEPPQQVFGDTVKKMYPQTLSRFHFKDEAEMDSEADPKWIVKDLISERSTVMMYGASGSYKSFLALDICLSVATGKPTFGSDTQAGLVFYGALEGKAHLRKGRRAWRILRGIEGTIDNFFVGMAPMIGVEGEVQEFGDEIAKRCAGRKPTLIVIDTLSKSMAGLNENDAADAGRFIRFCDSLVEAFGCTVLAIHHNGKEEGRGARGSSAFHAGFDTVLEVKAFKATKAVSVYVRKHKDAEEREIPWTFEGRVTGPSLTFEATTPEQHRLLVGDSKDVTPKKVGEALKGLKAFGASAGVSTAVLATQLTPAREDESVEDRAAAIARTSRALTSESKGKMEPYCTRHGKSFMWHLPAPAED